MEFEKELDKVIDTAWWGDYTDDKGNTRRGISNRDELKKAIKRAFEKRIIGKNDKIVNTFDDYIYGSWDDMYDHGRAVGGNETKDEMRKALWGRGEEHGR